MKSDYKFIAIKNGVIAGVILLAIYAVVVSLVSGWEFMLIQLSQFWFFIISLATGFGIQVGLFF